MTISFIARLFRVYVGNLDNITLDLLDDARHYERGIV